jgi:hypothetical protein
MLAVIGSIWIGMIILYASRGQFENPHPAARFFGDATISAGTHPTE